MDGHRGAERLLDVVTLNTWGLPPPLAPERKLRLPRIDRHLRAQAYDVVGLQEVWNGARRLLRREGLHVPTLAGDSGLALLSHHELHELHAQRFAEAVGFDAFKRKGFLEALLDVEDVGPIRVVVTHLQSGRSERASQTRNRQARQLLSRIVQLAEPVVLMGDFNLYDDLEADRLTLAAFEALGLVDAVAELDADRPTYPGDGSRLDRVFVRCSDALCLHPETALAIAELNALSDHRPVHVRLRAHRLE